MEITRIFSIDDALVAQYEVAVFVRRVLRHQEFNTQAKRMGTVIRVAHVGLLVWRSHTEQEIRFEWAR